MGLVVPKMGKWDKTSYFDLSCREPQVMTVQDYTPFGVLLDGRQTSATDSKYGFNGMRKDDELKGSGNSYTTDFRQYDPRLGRWLSIDPQHSTTF